MRAKLLTAAILLQLLFLVLHLLKLLLKLLLQLLASNLSLLITPAIPFAVITSP